MVFKPTAVFVDDEVNALSTMRRLFHGTPIEVLTFGRPREALEALGRTEVSVIVSDFRMPEMNGVELLTQVARLQPLAGRILLTGYADLPTALGAINRGAVARFLTKPWNEGELEEVVLGQTSRSVLERLLLALPAFQAETVALPEPEAIESAMWGFLRDTAGLSFEAAETPAGPGDEDLAVSAGGRTAKLRLTAAHTAVFRDADDLTRLRGLVSLAARTSLLAVSAREMERELARLSDTDGLSGLANRRAFDRELEREVSRSRRYATPLALMLIDIDRFKGINDTYGHPMGDEVIRRLGQILRQATRATDLAARYGGDEFAVILPGIDADHGVTLARRVRDRARELDVPGAAWGPLTLSMGVGMWSEGAYAADLLSRADEGVYRVKESGRDGVAFHGRDAMIHGPGGAGA